MRGTDCSLTSLKIVLLNNSRGGVLAVNEMMRIYKIS